MIQSVLAVAGVVALTIGIVVGWDEIVDGFTWSPGIFVIAVGLSAAGLMAVARSWSWLHPQDDRSRAFRRYLVMQPAKHIPGGIAHTVGLISSSTESSSVARSMSIFVRFSLVLLASGLAMGGLLLTDDNTAIVGALTTCAGVVVACLAGSRRLFSRIESWLPRISKRFAGEIGSLGQDQTSTSDVLRAIAFGLVGIGGLAAGFATIASAFGGMPGPIVLVGAFGVAWAVGYAALPVPAGIGVREWVLVALLAGSVGSGPVIAAAVAQRVAQIIAEAITAGWGYGLEARFQKGIRRPREGIER